MHRHIFFIVLLLQIVALPALIVETGSFKGFIYGSEPNCAYDNWVSHLAEKIVSPGYNNYSPWDRQTTGFGGFNVPSLTQLNNWGNVIDEFLLQNWANVDDLIAAYGFPYQLVQFNDTDTNRTYYLLRETLNDDYDDNGTTDTYDDEIGAFEWGWGLYLMNPTGDSRTILTVPHPCDDFFTPALSVTALSVLNAQFLMINGAGREVAWTGVNPYNNSKSLSDPTRSQNHPWYPAYTKFCDKIRTDTGKREFSLQIHSYDTALHTGFSSVQISAGYQKYCPNLPIRDLSRFKHDLINQASYLMLPANTIGSHSDVYVNDYYTVQYSTHPFTYSNGDTTVVVNNYMDLPAYSQNVQMGYTLYGWTDYDVYDPFLHVELDELPDCYAQNDNTYKWFWGWNAHTNKWKMDQLYDNALQYYSIWINDLAEVLPETLMLDNFIAPLPPTNLTVFNQAYDYITLRWEKADDFDFDSYEILYSTQPIGDTGYNIFSRSNNSYLASPHWEEINVTGLANATQYYFKIRARDKNSGFSTLSNEVTAVTSPTRIANFRGIGLDDRVAVRWNVSSQINNQGFRVYRAVEDGDFTLMDSYQTNTGLAGGSSSYLWNDDNVVNGTAYTYKISSVTTLNAEFFHNVTANAYPRNYYTLRLKDQFETVSDSLTFSANPNASAGNDGDYDVVKANAPTSNYVYGAFWQQYWGTNGTYLQQEVKDDFDPNENIRTWTIRVKSDRLNIPLLFSVDDSFGRYTEKLYLRDNSTAFMHDLETGPYTFQVQDTNYKNFTLYWGNLQPSVSIVSLPNRIYQGGSTQIFNFSANYSSLIDHFDVSIQTETDSLLVAANLPNTTTNYNFTFPTDVQMQKARLVVDGWATDGQRIRTYSSYQFGIVPLNITYAPEPGLMMQSNVWTNTSPLAETVFGPNALAWTMDSNSNWWLITPFSYGLGYFINKENAFEYTSNNPIVRDSLAFVIRTGWNTIPNPHLCAYGVKDLKFRINGIYYSFAEMMEQNLVSRGVFVYRNNEYVVTDVIYPQESFLLKYYGSPLITAAINFLPYNSGVDVSPINPLWQLRISASQDECDKAELIVGSNPKSTNGYDFKYDLPEPPMKPLPNLSRLYLTRSAGDTEFIDRQLHTEFRTAFGLTEDEEQVFNFTLEAGNTNPVHLMFDTENLPDGYGVAIHLGNVQYDIQHGNELIYQPAMAGPVTGQLYVRNYFTSNQDEAMPSLTGLKAYPNPFNPETSISFNLNKAEQVKVEIYNIKGQRVRTLFDGLSKSGRQRLVWNGRDDKGKAIGSGLYFARVKTSDQTQVIKMILLK